MFLQATLVQISRGVQLLHQLQFLLQNVLEERWQGILNGDPREAPALRMLVGSTHVEPVLPHLAKEVPGTPLTIRHGLVTGKVAIVADQWVTQTLHGDSHLVLQQN